MNDRYGHPGGDAVLRGLGERLALVLRAEDVAVRWGGEEFLVIMPATDGSGALTLAERLRVIVKGELFVVDDEQQCDITLSIGCATFADEEAKDLLQRADEALYEAKTAGRDRVVVAD